jgi:isoleucyl-tRNA synthetase
MSTVMENKAPFRTLLGHALVRDSNGKEMHKSAGNAIWFNDAADEMGVDVMRWLFINHNVESNLNFGYEAANDVRKKVITLWNSYSFFATYAAVDGFNPLESKIQDSDLTIMDLWIRAKLHQLIQDMHSSFEVYRLDKSMRKVEVFIEDLSNWYIRRNRRRFWKSENDSDKQAAYHTLYEVLLTLTKLLAPIMPFITEEMYKNLVVNLDESALKSVHLCDYPEVISDYIDDDLVQQVDALKKVVELGRSARNKADLKIRQPLQSLFYVINDDNLSKFLSDNKSVILDELNVKEIKRVNNAEELITYIVKPNLAILGKTFGQAIPSIRNALADINVNDVINQIQVNGQLVLNTDSGELTLKQEHILIETSSSEGLVAAQDEGFTVALSTVLNDKLIQEGLVRDLIRQVQIMRKNADFAVEDRIVVFGDFGGEIGKALNVYKDYFCNETLTISIEPKGSEVEFSETIKIKGEKITLGISRVIKD